MVAAGLLGFSKCAKSYEMLIAGRIISGINAGKLSVMERTDKASTSHFRYQQFTTERVSTRGVVVVVAAVAQPDCLPTLVRMPQA